MNQRIKKYIIIVVLILVNILLVYLTVNSVIESMKKVWENEGPTTAELIEPTVNIQSKLVDGKPTFVIDVEDDNIITTLTIIHNEGKEHVIYVNETSYHYEVIMEQGINTLIVIATDDNELSKERRVKFENM